MTKENVQKITIMNNKNSAFGPQIVLPFFRPISIYEIEDSYESLVTEIKESKITDFQEETITFLKAFKDSLEDKSADPLFNYFVFNHGNEVDIHQIQDVFDALDDFIESATDENRPMH